MGEVTDVMRSKIAAFNEQDGKTYMTLCGPEVEWEVPGAPVLRGRDQVLPYFSAFWEAFPDLRLTVTSVVEEGSVVAIQGRATGTHRGTLRTPPGDIPSTGRVIDFTFAEDYEVRGGLIVSAHLHFDRLELLEQLGVTPAPVPA